MDNGLRSSEHNKLVQQICPTYTDLDIEKKIARFKYVDRRHLSFLLLTGGILNLRKCLD